MASAIFLRAPRRGLLSVGYLVGEASERDEGSMALHCRLGEDNSNDGPRKGAINGRGSGCGGRGRGRVHLPFTTGTGEKERA